MNANEVASDVIAESGMTAAQLSHKMGKERTYIYTTVGRGRTPRADTLAKIADACGYDLLVRRRIDGYETVIDPYD